MKELFAFVIITRFMIVSCNWMFITWFKVVL